MMGGFRSITTGSWRSCWACLEAPLPLGVTCKYAVYEYAKYAVTLFSFVIVHDHAGHDVSIDNKGISTG